jgi:hypothetical protein
MLSLPEAIKLSHEIETFVKSENGTFDSWVAAEQFFSKIMGRTIVSSNIKSAAEGVSLNIRDVVRSTRSPIACLTNRIADLEERVANLESEL